MTTAGEEMPPVNDEISGWHAWGLIGVGSAVTTFGAVAPEPDSFFAYGAAAWFFLFQVGTSLSARRARNSWIRGEHFTKWLNIVAMVVFGLMAHEGFVQAFAVAQENGLALGMSPELLYWVFFAVPFLEPVGFWTNAVHSEWRTLNAPTKPLSKSSTGRPYLRDVGGKVALGLGALGAGLGGAGAHAHEAALVQQPKTGEAPIVQMADAQTVQRARIGEARKLYGDGVNKSEIARRLHVHRNTVAAWLKAA